LVRKLEQRSVAAVCIEDKLFPKTNSFIDGDKQELASIDEFCSRIKAGKDAQLDDDFCIITRVEAFIAGWGLDEALKRAEAYHAAGADGILIHSALSHPAEVLAFKREWAERSPVVIVPTKYYATPTDVFRDEGFAMVIWANHLLRSAIQAMQGTAQQLHDQQTLVAVEDHIVPVKEIFRLQGASELQEAEERYLPQDGQDARVIVLAASRGAALGELTDERPKTMVEVRGRPLLAHIVAAYNVSGIKRICVVRGYRAEAINLAGLKYVDNEAYASTSELASLQLALQSDPDDSRDLFIHFGDVVFKRHLLDPLTQQDEDFVIAVDADWQESVNRGRAADYVSCTEPHSRRDFYQRILLTGAGETLPEAHINGEWMGLLRVSATALPRLRKVVDELMSDSANRTAKLHHLLAALVAADDPVRVIYATGNWLDVDSLDDLVAAGAFL
jgi:phosphoenolpyruvate phosphomutase